MVKNIVCIGVLVMWTGLAVAQTGLNGALSEKDFLADVPIVLSVSRLPQRLDETPGAVTILDQEMIRRSGARDVADLLRMVPGFQTTTSFERGAPAANYHGAFDGYGGRIQVLVDGRSVYSPYLFGGTSLGLQSFSLADIERIEVLRGSNSAAYGARAMLGVVNIVTRHTVDTLGLQATLGAGENGVRDAQARVGWNYSDASFRLSVDRRADDGLTGSNGHNQVSRLNFRSDVRVSNSDELQLRAGAMGIAAGAGWRKKVEDPFRDRTVDTAYAQLNWRRILGVDEDISMGVSHTGEKHVDNYPFAPIPGITIDYGGRATNDTFLLQHTSRQGDNVRLVVGGELRRESVVSRPLYNREDRLVTNFARLFANAEWRMAPPFVLNAGGLYEKRSGESDTFSPRVMVNWHAAENQTLRVGVSKATRPPSTFEQFANVQYSKSGKTIAVIALARGNLEAESLVASELGYLGEFPNARVSVDARIFQEKMRNKVKYYKDTTPNYFLNGDALTITGIEYELKWRPWRDAQFILGQTYIDLNSALASNSLIAPKLASTLSFFQKLPGGLDLSVMYSNNGETRMASSSQDNIYAMRRTDLRLALPLRSGGSKGELALVVQNLGSPYRDFDPAFTFKRRAFVTLRLEN